MAMTAAKTMIVDFMLDLLLCRGFGVLSLLYVVLQRLSVGEDCEHWVCEVGCSPTVLGDGTDIWPSGSRLKISWLRR